MLVPFFTQSPAGGMTPGGRGRTRQMRANLQEGPGCYSFTQQTFECPVGEGSLVGCSPWDHK